MRIYRITKHNSMGGPLGAARGVAQELVHQLKPPFEETFEVEAGQVGPGSPAILVRQQPLAPRIGCECDGDFATGMETLPNYNAVASVAGNRP